MEVRCYARDKDGYYSQLSESNFTIDLTKRHTPLVDYIAANVQPVSSFMLLVKELVVAGAALGEYLRPCIGSGRCSLTLDLWYMHGFAIGAGSRAGQLAL